ncbi:MAG TPA: 50S ribosomal protein L25 [Candidatus Saccharimonadales bacterium]
MSQDLITIELEPREILGKSVKHLRTSGKTPAVIHNHGKDSIIVQGDSIAMLKVYRQAGKHHTIDVTTSGKTYTTLIKTAEFEPRKQQLTHIVFNAVSANQKVEAEIPIHPKYDEGNESSPAERSGLMVLSNLDQIKVESIPSKLPDVIYFNAEKLVEVGDHVMVSDLILPEGVEVKEDANQTIASVFEPSAVAAANDAAGGAAEEVEEEAAEATEDGEATEEAKTEEATTAKE